MRFFLINILCFMAAQADLCFAQEGPSAPVTNPASQTQSGDEVQDFFKHHRTDLDGKQLANATVGRYLYMGVAPRFAAENIEIYISKIGLTNRVKTWVPVDMPGNYARFLLERWQRILAAFSDPKMSFDRMTSVDQLMASARNSGQKAWLTIAAQYMKHALEGWGLDVYDAGQSPEQYKSTILTALLREYLNDPSLTIDDGRALVAKLRDENERAAGAQWSEQLFFHHFGKIFTADSSRGPRYRGFLTFVYPIAADTEGPFVEPAEGIKKIGMPGTIESRFWSDKWKDEFGGFPFLLINYDGVAFHGPISNRSDMDIWYLRRDYVSHGCHRMDESDVMELRAILPTDFAKLLNQKKGIRTVITEWPDVTDWNNDGALEAIDVKYYEVPSSLSVPKGKTPQEAAKKWLLPDAQKNYWKKQYARFNGKLEPKNRFDLETGRFYGLPKYEIVGEKLQRNGPLDGIPVYSFDHQDVRVIQYREQGVDPDGFDDASGKYPPSYFNRP